MVAICFYTPDSYAELKKIADDKSTLCDTYADWLVEFTKAVRAFETEGVKVNPVTININDLKDWCRKNKLKNIGSSRSKYVAELSKNQLLPLLASAPTRQITKEPTLAGTPTLASEDSGLIHGIGEVAVKSDTAYYLHPHQVEYPEANKLIKMNCEQLDRKYK